jgi:hypothetical protein
MSTAETITERRNLVAAYTRQHLSAAQIALRLWSTPHLRVTPRTVVRDRAALREGCPPWPRKPRRTGHGTDAAGHAQRGER